MSLALIVWLVFAASFASDLRREIPDLDDCLRTNRQSLRSVLTVSRAQLGAASEITILIRGTGICLAGANNGPYWVYRGSEGKWVQILSSSGYKAEPLRARHNGFADVAIWGHSSAYESVRRVYEFTGVRYQAASCRVVTFGNADGWFKTHRREACDFDWRRE